MTETSAPDAAVQIARNIDVDELTEAEARAVVAALAREGWLHDPAEVAALRAVADLHKRHEPDETSYWPYCPECRKTWPCRTARALDALPPTDVAPAPPGGEDTERHITPEMVNHLAARSGHLPRPHGQVMTTLHELIAMYEASADLANQQPAASSPASETERRER